MCSIRSSRKAMCEGSPLGQCAQPSSASSFLTDMEGWFCGCSAVSTVNGSSGNDLPVEFSEGWSHRGTDMNYHSTIDDRSLAFGRAIAARLVADGSLLERAGATLARWLESCSPQARPTLLEWKSALERPLEEVVALLTGSSERAVRLRQSNPFAGVLPQDERLAIIREFEAREFAGHE